MLVFWMSFNLKFSVPWICKVIYEILRCEDIFENIYSPSLLEWQKQWSLDDMA